MLAFSSTQLDNHSVHALPDCIFECASASLDAAGNQARRLSESTPLLRVRARLLAALGDVVGMVVVRALFCVAFRFFVGNGVRRRARLLVQRRSEVVAAERQIVERLGAKLLLPAKSSLRSHRPTADRDSRLLTVTCI